MNNLKPQLLAGLSKLAGVEDRQSTVSGGSALFYKGKSFAHFHHDNELDIRLTRKVMKDLGLSHPAGSVSPPPRSTPSQWNAVRFNTPSDVEHVLKLVALAVAAL